MYSKEMKGRQIPTISGGGGGDISPSTLRYDSKEERFPGGGGDNHNYPVGSNQEKTDGDFTLNYGNYGDPYSFISYQLILLLIDFLFNWTMDLVHESPLAVLVIFVFQSLAIIINVILYIMASASQAMQVGIHKRVNIHHWLNLCTCLAYITMTGWWFIWALRKSWPSVSDQFSFTWRGDDIKLPNGTIINATTIAPPTNRMNMTRQSTEAYHHQIKEHYTLWCPGFNAVYVIHRSLAMLYYFIYLRASFLVLNSQKMGQFLEMKREFVRRLWEERKRGTAVRKSATGRKRVSSTSNNYSSIPITSTMNLGMDEYLSGNGLESTFGDKSVGSGSGGGRKRAKKQMSVTWTDENTVERKGSSSHTFVGEQEDDDDQLPSKEITKVKGRRRKNTEDGNNVNVSNVGGLSGEWNLKDKGRIDSADKEDVPPRPKPRPRSSHHDKRQRDEMRDRVEEWKGDED